MEGEGGSARAVTRRTRKEEVGEGATLAEELEESFFLFSSFSSFFHVCKEKREG